MPSGFTLEDGRRFYTVYGPGQGPGITSPRNFQVTLIPEFTRFEDAGAREALLGLAAIGGLAAGAVVIEIAGPPVITWAWTEYKGARVILDLMNALSSHPARPPVEHIPPPARPTEITAPLE